MTWYLGKRSHGAFSEINGVEIVHGVNNSSLELAFQHASIPSLFGILYIPNNDGIGIYILGTFPAIPKQTDYALI